jgi:cysteinyl-tRNA synthetase
MHLYNTLTKKIEDLVPDNPDQVRMYSCGPTVYDRAHIGNLASFIYADVMRRSLKSSYNIIHHVMNFTDVDDKTINASKVNQQKSDSMSALKQLTELQIKYFINDAEKIGIDTKSIQFIKATDSIKEIQNLINDLYKKILHI